MTTTGRIDANDSDIASISYAEQSGDPAVQAARWQSYFKAGGMYHQDLSGTVVRLLTSADLSSLEAHDADLTIIAALSVAAGKFIVGRDPGSGAAWAADTIQTTDIPDISATYQPRNSDLDAILGLTSAADKLPYFTGSHTAALADFTAAGRALVDDADAAAQRTTLGLVIGTDVEAHDADLTAIAALTGTGVPKRTGTSTWALIAPEFYILGAGAWQSLTNGSAPSAKWELSTNKQDFWSLDFDKDAIEYAQATIKMPADWDGSTLTAEVDWTAASGSGDVIFTIEAVAYADGDDLDRAWGTAVDLTADTLIGTNKFHRTATSGAITVGNSPAAGKLVQFRISRKATAAGDTLSADARLLGTTIHYGIA